MTRNKKLIIGLFILFALALVSPAVLGEGQGNGEGDDFNDPLPTFAPNAWDIEFEYPSGEPAGDGAGIDIAGMNDTISVQFEAYYFDENGRRIFVRAANGGYETGRGLIIDVPNPSSRIQLTAPYGIPSDEVYYRLTVTSSFTNGHLDTTFMEGVNYCVDADLNLPVNLPPKTISDVNVEMSVRASVHVNSIPADWTTRYIDSYSTFFPTQVLRTRSWVEIPGGGSIDFDTSTLFVVFKADGNIFSNAPSFTGNFSDYYEMTKETDDSIFTRLFSFDSGDLVTWLEGRNDGASACTELLLGTFHQMKREHEQDSSDTLFSFDGFNLNIGGTDYGQIIPSFSISTGFDTVTVNGQETYIIEVANILRTIRRYVTYFLAIVFLYTYIKMYLRLFGVKSERVVE